MEWEDNLEHNLSEIVDLKDKEELALLSDEDFAVGPASPINGDFFLPKFLNYIIRLNKDYPNIKLFL